MPFYRKFLVYPLIFLFYVSISTIVIKGQTTEEVKEEASTSDNMDIKKNTKDEKEDKEEKEKVRKMPVIGVGVGLMSFHGDVKEENIGDPNSYRYGLDLKVRQPVAGGLGIGLSLLYGKLAGNQMSTHLNFETTVMGGGLHLVYSFDDGMIMKKNARIAPYIHFGGQYNMLKTNGDLNDAKGRKYHYWNDGTIRDEEEPDKDPDDSDAKRLQRDYTYESALIVGSHSAISIPIGVGIKFRISNQLSVNLGAEYHYTLSDKIDALESGSSDKFSYTSVSIHYDFFRPKSELDPEELRFMNVDILFLDSKDTDGDGIIDFRDICPGTPKGIKVNRYGCPYDGDNDGVPDYRDEDPNTRGGAVVDINGIELKGTEGADVLARYLKPDSLALSNLTQGGSYVVSNMAAFDSIIIKNVGSREIVFNSRILFNDTLIVPPVEGTNPYFTVTNVSKNETWLVSNLNSGDKLSVTSIYDEKLLGRKKASPDTTESELEAPEQQLAMDTDNNSKAMDSEQLSDIDTTEAEAEEPAGEEVEEETPAEGQDQEEEVSELKTEEIVEETTEKIETPEPEQTVQVTEVEEEQETEEAQESTEDISQITEYQEIEEEAKESEPAETQLNEDKIEAEPTKEVINVEPEEKINESDNVEIQEPVTASGEAVEREEESAVQDQSKETSAEPAKYIDTDEKAGTEAEEKVDEPSTISSAEETEQEEVLPSTPDPHAEEPHEDTLQIVVPPAQTEVADDDSLIVSDIPEDVTPKKLTPKDQKAGTIIRDDI
ncbi:hypothetical protein JYT51_01920, partial [Candidatus Amoebophilus asiaticus]|nr:hypothetical protein [Candidatus Amoebophilus asiaticus]